MVNGIKAGPANSEEQHLHDALIKIATDGVERRNIYRHRR